MASDMLLLKNERDEEMKVRGLKEKVFSGHVPDNLCLLTLGSREERVCVRSLHAFAVDPLRVRIEK